MDDKFLRAHTAQVPVAYSGDAPVHPGPYYPPGPVLDPGPRQPAVLSQIREMVIRRWWTLILAFLAVMAVAAYMIHRTPRTYTSEFSILIGKGEGSSSDGLGTLLSLSGSNSIETELQLIHSQRVIEPVVDRFDMHVGVSNLQGTRPADVLPKFDASRNTVAGSYVIRKTAEGGVEVLRTDPDSVRIGVFAPGQKVSADGLSFEVPKDLPGGEVDLWVGDFESAVAGVTGSVSASLAGDNASLVNVFCYAGTPKQAQRICQGVADSYLVMRNDLERSEAVQSADWLRKQSETISKQLAEAEDAMRRYKETRRVVEPDAQANQEIQQLAGLQARRDQLLAEQTALASFRSGIEESAGTDRYRQLATYPTFIQNPMVGDILRNLVDYENQLAQLSERRTEQNPDVIALRQRISDLENQLGSMARNYEMALSRQITSMNQILGRSQGRLAAVPETQVALARLQRNVDLLNELYKTLQQKLQGAEISKAVELADVTIIDPASLPESPSAPDVKRTVALALVAGLLFGLAAAMLLEFADTRLRRADEVEREAGLPVLTMVPRVKGKRLRLIPGRNPKRLRKAAGGGAQPRLIDYYPMGGELVVEAFRSLGTDLSFAAKTAVETGARIVVFTSPWRGEGKTFSAVNFAATRALQGSRTLLIDADLRAGSAGALLGLAQDVGLSDVLSGRVPMLDAVRMVKVGDHRLAVLGAGPLQPESGNLLGAQQLEEILSTAAENFEQVVIDTPPLNLVSDAAVFAAHADAVMVVVRAGKTEREALDLTLSRLGRVGARRVGIVLNEVKAPDRKYTSGYEYARSTTAS